MQRTTIVAYTPIFDNALNKGYKVKRSGYKLGIRPFCNKLYGTDAALGNLISINTQTGSGTIIGKMLDQAPSLATDPTTGILYAGTGGGIPVLFTVDPNTGRPTFVGNTGLGEFHSIAGLDFRSDGTLFASVNIIGGSPTGADHLAILNKSTGEATVVGPYGICDSSSCTIEGMEGIAFDETGTLWGSLRARRSDGTPGLYTIDTKTGAATFVTRIQNPDGSTPSGGVVSLQFCNNLLFGGTANAILPATDGGKLIVIDPSTGFWSFVGTGTATGGSSLGGLARVF